MTYYLFFPSEDHLCVITALLFIRIKEREQATEEEMMEQKKEAEELEQFQELYIKEQTTRKQKKQEEKRNIMKAYQVSSTQTL